MYKVFLSSTSRDLTVYREALHRAIDGLDGFHLVAMEQFGARDASAREFCEKLVGQCDVLIGLLGHYYGSRPPGEDVSYTELEYRTARALGLPRLAFVAPDDFAIPAKLSESDDSFEPRSRDGEDELRRAIEEPAKTGRPRDRIAALLPADRAGPRSRRRAASSGIRPDPYLGGETGANSTKRQPPGREIGSARARCFKGLPAAPMGSRSARKLGPH